MWRHVYWQSSGPISAVDALGRKYTEIYMLWGCPVLAHSSDAENGFLTLYGAVDLLWFTESILANG